MTAQRPQRDATGSADAPIGEVLGRTARELNHLSARLLYVEAAVGPLVLDAAPCDPSLVRRIQELDHIRQRVEGLAHFIAALALISPDQCLVDAGAAARLVTLADLAARLTLADASAAEHAGDWGDCELF